MLVRVLFGFFAFSAAASAAYLLNDLIDIGADRHHPTKRNRPFASGILGWKEGIAAVCLLMGGAVAVSLLLSLPFAITLVFYVALTISYSVFLKRKMLIDVVVLAMLYTVRVIAGGVLIGVEISEWLLAFSLFVFTALALMKRYTELTVHPERGATRSAQSQLSQGRPVGPGGTLRGDGGECRDHLRSLYLLGNGGGRLFATEAAMADLSAAALHAGARTDVGASK